MRGQWQLELEHVSGRTKNFTDLEIDEKILLILEGTGDTWGITVSCVTANVCFASAALLSGHFVLLIYAQS